MIRSKDNRKKIGYIITLAGGACWGFSGCCGQFLFEHKGGTAEWLVALRLVFAGLILTSIGFLRDGKRNMRVFKNRGDTGRLLVFSFAGIALSQYTYFAAIQHSNAGTATVLQYLFPIFILAVLCIQEMRKPGRLEVFAIFLSLTGTFLLGTHGDFTSLHMTPQALGYGLAAAAAAVLYNMLPGNMIQKYGLFQIVGFGMLFSGLVFLGVIRPWRYEVIWDMETAATLFGVIVIGTALGFGLYLRGVSLVGPLTGSLLASVEPVVAVILSAFWLHTSFIAIDLAGFAMILCTVMLLSLRPARQK
ncbi:DMT family transporter [Lachnospiraceae bacterium 62-35]